MSRCIYIYLYFYRFFFQAGILWYKLVILYFILCVHISLRGSLKASRITSLEVLFFEAKQNRGTDDGASF